MLSRLVLAVAALFISSVAAAHACERRAPDSAFVNAILEPGERRVAFVAGVGAYQTLPALPNPPRDAQAVSERLASLGFEVYAAINPNADDFSACFAQFEAVTARATVALFYFAGHGVQFGDANYMTVTDSRIANGQPQSFFALDEYMTRLSRSNAARLIFLDACRDNPLSGQSVTAGGAARSIRAGLAPLPQSSASPQGGGQFVAFSTSPNATAADGSGTLSPFSQAFIANVGAPGVSVQRVMVDVTRAVGELTQYGQTPWTRSSLTRDVYLNGRLERGALQAASEAFAAESERLLIADDRDGAIAMALKGIPLASPDAPAFAAARNAYQKSARSLRVKLPVRVAASENAQAVVSFDARRVIVGVEDDARQRVSLWNADSGAKIAEFAFAHAPMAAAWNLAFSPDNTRAVLADESTGEILLVDTIDGHVVQRFTASAMVVADSPIGGKYGGVMQLQSSNQGAHVVVSTTARTFVWDVAGRRVVLDVPRSGRLQAAIRPDGSEVAISAPGLRASSPGVFAPQNESDNTSRVHRFDARNGALLWSSDAFDRATPIYTSSGRYLLGEVKPLSGIEGLVVWDTRTNQAVSQADRVQGIVDADERFTLGNTGDRAIYTFPGLRPVTSAADAPVPVIHKVLDADGREIPSFMSPRTVVWPTPASITSEALEQRRRALPAPLADAVAAERLRAAR